MRPGHEFAAHAREMARRWAVRMVEDSGLPKDEAHAQPGQRVVVHAPIVDETSYIVSMHEMGHIVHAAGWLRPGMTFKTKLDEAKVKLVEEEAAWEWAAENVLDGEWTAGMEQVKAWALQTYVDVHAALARGEEPTGDLLTVLQEMFGGPAGPPPPPPIPHDPTAVVRRQSTYRGMAQSIVSHIKKGGSE